MNGPISSPPPPSPNAPRYAESGACAREPIHIPGSIQPHGVLLAVREPESLVTHVSENAAMVFAHPAMLGAKLEEVLTPSEFEPLRRELRTGEVRHLPRRVATINQTIGLPFDVLAHRHAGRLILEFEPALRTDESERVGDRLHAETSVLEQATSLDALGRAIVEAVRRISGFEKVMLYRFDEDWNGTVIAEVGPRDGMEMYMGLRFPASDIPAQARELYRVNPVRLIPAVDQTPARLLAIPGENAPLDLTHSILRGVAPVHLEYLQNMNVASSMSVSVLRERRLWGLIACHHRAPRFVSQPVRLACSVLGQLISQVLAGIELRAEAEHTARMRAIQVRLVKCAAKREPFSAALMECGGDLLKLLEADGAAVCSQGECRLIGHTPTSQEVAALTDWICARDTPLISTNWLAGEYPPVLSFGEKIGGLVAITLARAQRALIIWFRREQIETVNWAGDPRKAVDTQSERIHPRRSFTVWQEQVGERCYRWRTPELEAAAALREALLDLYDPLAE